LIKFLLKLLKLLNTMISNYRRLKSYISYKLSNMLHMIGIYPQYYVMLNVIGIYLRLIGSEEK